MPFGKYYEQPKFNIDYSNRTPVTVVVNFNVKGKFYPAYFRYIHPDQSEKTFKIDSIKYTREKSNGTSFCCMFDNHGRQQEIILTFYTMKCVWVIEKCN